MLVKPKIDLGSQIMQVVVHIQTNIGIVSIFGERKSWPPSHASRRTTPQPMCVGLTNAPPYVRAQKHRDKPGGPPFCQKMKAILVLLYDFTHTDWSRSGKVEGQYPLRVVLAWFLVLYM